MNNQNQNQTPDPNNPLGGGFPEFGGEPDVGETLDTGTPAVAQTPGKMLIIIIGLLGVVAFVLITLLTGDDDKKKKTALEEKEQNIRRTVIREDVPVLPPAPPPAPPPLPQPAQLPKPPLPVPPSPEEIEFNEADMAALKARRQSDSMIYKSKGLFGKGLMGDKKGEEKPAEVNDPNQRFAMNAIRDSEAESAEATFIGNLGNIIAQGKVLDAVLETAINTDLPGTLRAIISHDIYAEKGRDILIPKGSRLIGTYNTGILRGQDRVFIVWTRVIRPDGVDIQIGSQGIDNLGRAGVPGDVDNKFTEIFSSAILTSILTLGTAVIVQASVEDSATTTTTNTDGSSQTSGEPVALAAQDLSSNISSLGKDFIEEYINVKPTITIDQGTSMKVFVNRDLIFPDSIQQRVHIVP